MLRRALALLDSEASVSANARLITNASLTPGSRGRRLGQLCRDLEPGWFAGVSTASGVIRDRVLVSRVGEQTSVRPGFDFVVNGFMTDWSPANNRGFRRAYVRRSRARISLSGRLHCPARELACATASGARHLAGHCPARPHRARHTWSPSAAGDQGEICSSEKRRRHQ